MSALTRLPFLCGLLLLLGACATGSPVQVQTELDRWVGQDADALVRAWGPPDRSYDFKNQSRVLEYERNRIETYGGWSAPHGSAVIGSDGSAIGVGFPVWQSEPRISTRRCLMTFETDAKRIIRRAGFTGTNCAYALQTGLKR